MTNLDILRPAAEAGNIEDLYTVIEKVPSILREIDLEQFVETPLPIAAFNGHLPFAIEVMNLKPSLAFKLNKQGFSPIHLAMQKKEKTMVLCFVDINKDLVRVKGKEGWTPLHYASQIGEVDLLAYFLNACPESIEYLTVRCETALHIAINNAQFDALKVLVGWLEKNYRTGAIDLENRILNQKDLAGNTILHISASTSDQHEAVRLLVNTKINLKTKNFEDKTALDIATTESKKILCSAGAKSGTQVIDAHTPAYKLSSETTIIDKLSIYMHRISRNITDEQRNTMLIVAALVVTATYQSVLSPPGGVYQVNASDKNLNITSSNSTISTLGNAGKSVMSEVDFFRFSFWNIVSFLISIAVILILTPAGKEGSPVYVPLTWFALSYLYSMRVISPTHFNSVFVGISYISIYFYSIIFLIIAGYFSFQKWIKAKKLRRSVLRHRNIAETTTMVVAKDLENMASQI